MNTISFIRALISVFFAGYSSSCPDWYEDMIETYGSLDNEDAEEELNAIKRDCRDAIDAALQAMALHGVDRDQANALIDEYLYAKVR